VPGKLTNRCKPALCPLLLLVLGLAVFGGLALAVPNHVTDDSDLQILRSLREPDHPKQFLGPPWLRGLLNDSFDVTALGSETVLTLLVLLVAVYLCLCRQWPAACSLILVAVTGALANWELKQVFDRPRPPEYLRLVPVHGTSFPSGHAMLSAVIYLTLAGLLTTQTASRALRIYVWIVAALLAILVGFSRVSLGAHYPTDVVGGWSAGLAVAMFWLLIASCWRGLRARGNGAFPPTA
jgi:undecaprenyl-diphosphatase